MADVTCSICLEQLKSPVATPCGHVHCEKCLTSHIQTEKDACNAHCPTCRAKFTIAIPDLRYVPKKYHEFMKPGVRKLYLEIPSQAKLKEQIALLESRVESLGREKVLLTNKCESNMATSAMHAEDCKKLRVTADKAIAEAAELQRKYDSLKNKYHTLRSKTMSGDVTDSHPHSWSHNDFLPVVPNDQAEDTSTTSSRLKRPLPSRVTRQTVKNSSKLPADDDSMSVDLPTSSHKRSRVSDTLSLENLPRLHNSDPAIPATRAVQSVRESKQLILTRRSQPTSSSNPFNRFSSR